MQETPNLKLKKPDLTDYVNVGDLNENADLIDAAVTENKDSLATHLAENALFETEVRSSILIRNNVSILSASWTDDTLVSGFWLYEIDDSDISASTVVDVNIHLADLEKADAIKPANLSSAGKVTLYADEKPAENILADLKLVRRVA